MDHLHLVCEPLSNLLTAVTVFGSPSDSLARITLSCYNREMIQTAFLDAVQLRWS